MRIAFQLTAELTSLIVQDCIVAQINLNNTTWSVSCYDGDNGISTLLVGSQDLGGDTLHYESGSALWGLATTGAQVDNLSCAFAGSFLTQSFRVYQADSA